MIDKNKQIQSPSGWSYSPSATNKEGLCPNIKYKYNAHAASVTQHYCLTRPSPEELCSYVHMIKLYHIIDYRVPDEKGYLG